MSRTVEQMIADYACPETFSDGEGRKWECLGPRDHPGVCWPSQTEGPPPPDPGDYGGMST